jgi:hypothetical protein
MVRIGEGKTFKKRKRWYSIPGTQEFIPPDEEPEKNQERSNIPMWDKDITYKKLGPKKKWIGGWTAFKLIGILFILVYLLILFLIAQMGLRG